MVTGGKGASWPSGACARRASNRSRFGWSIRISDVSSMRAILCFAGILAASALSSFCVSSMTALKSPGVANKDLWVDFAYRSEHLMSVVGKQLSQAFYGKQPELMGAAASS